MAHEFLNFEVHKQIRAQTKLISTLLRLDCGTLSIHVSPGCWLSAHVFERDDCAPLSLEEMSRPDFLVLLVFHFVFAFSL